MHTNETLIDIWNKNLSLTILYFYLCVFFQGQKYYYYEMGKNSDPSKEDNVQFNNALTVHPVSDPEQMYRLHKHFTEIELQKTYEEIEKLQVPLC